MNPVDIERGEAQGRAVQELLTGGYAHEPVSERVFRTIDQFIGDLLDFVPGGLLGSILSGVLIVLVVLAIAGLLLWYGRKATKGRAVTGDGIFAGRVMTADEHRAEAERLAAEGSYGGAVRERLRAVARGLEERALVDAQPGRTADELAAEAGRVLPGFAADLVTAARVFDDVTYGQVPGTVHHYETLRTLDERLRTAKPTLEVSR